MTRLEIQERLEAIVEEINPSLPQLSLRDEIHSYFDEPEVEEFFSLVAEEFELDEQDLFDSPPSTFYILTEWIGSEIN